jgi:hypothetical protein
MAHLVGLRDAESEARRGLSLARLGLRREAEEAAASAERDPPHDALAELYQVLGERAKARYHALRGYKLYWANGPPYSFHWPLQTCRAVLRALGEPEPHLPRFEGDKITPFAYEAEILHLLAEDAPTGDNGRGLEHNEVGRGVSADGLDKRKHTGFAWTRLVRLLKRSFGLTGPKST